MMASRNFDWWWDTTWNPVGGCTAISPGCTNCYAAQVAGTKTYPYAAYSGIHNGVTVTKGTRRIFNGQLTVAPDDHPTWQWPLKWPGSKNPALGPGKPSLVFVGDMSDVFHEERPSSVIDRICSAIAISDHIGLLLTKRAARMREHFTAQSPHTVRLWKPRLWLGFSAERQREFDPRWADMRALADAGYMVFVSIAPMIGPVTLPDDFLARGPRVWVIVAGEQGRHDRCRDMDPDWVRAIRDQCKSASIPFFLKQMARAAPIPPDLQIRRFPSLT